MKNAEWMLMFLVPSVYVATDTVAMINTSVRMILFFAVGLVTAISERRKKAARRRRHAVSMAVKAV